MKTPKDILGEQTPIQNSRGHIPRYVLACRRIQSIPRDVGVTIRGDASQPGPQPQNFCTLCSSERIVRIISLFKVIVVVVGVV